MTDVKKQLIQDGESLVSAKTRYGYDIHVYDDGFGPLWIARNSIGIYGIVRAQTFCDAYSICEDEFFDEASETLEEIQKEYGFRREHVKMIDDGTKVRAAQIEDYGDKGLKSGLTFVRWDYVDTKDPSSWPENELFQESFGFRPNGPRVKDVLKHGIYSKDLNGDYLDELTPELANELEITLEIQPEE